MTFIYKILQYYFSIKMKDHPAVIHMSRTSYVYVQSEMIGFTGTNTTLDLFVKS